MVRKQHLPTEAERTLGRNIERMRLAKGISRKQLGKFIKETEQQIAKYENGTLIPLANLEVLAKSMGEEIPKKLIRRISTLRKIEKDSKVEQKELIDLYNQALPTIEE